MQQHRLIFTKIDIIKCDDEIYVPLKIFCDSRNLDFNAAMIYFNGFNLSIEKSYKQLNGETYLCFVLRDFIVFIFIISAINKKAAQLADKLAKNIAMRNFNTVNKTPILPEEIIGRYLKLPKDGDKVEFMQVSDIRNLLPKEMQDEISNTTIGTYLKRFGFKKHGKRLKSGPRYGYDVTLL